MAQLAFDDELEARPLQVVGLETTLGSRRAIEETPEDVAPDVHDTPIFADVDGELDGIALGVPVGIGREAEAEERGASAPA